MVDSQTKRRKIGAAFSPYRQFRNLLVPEAMARNPELPPGAKLVYARLRRYYGADGKCYPRVDTLGKEVALGERQVQKHLRTLEQEGYIRTVKRYKKDGAQTSNAYVFLWHSTFDEWEADMEKRMKGVNSNSPSPLKPNSPRPVNPNSPKEGQSQEGQLEEANQETVIHVDMGDPRLWCPNFFDPPIRIEPRRLKTESKPLG